MKYGDAAWMESSCTGCVWESEHRTRGGEPGLSCFLGSAHFLILATGFVGPGMGLSIAWTMLAGTLGILCGALFMTSPAAPGLAMAWSQRIRSRAAFDGHRTLPILSATLFVSMGFNIVNITLAMQGMRSVFGIDPTVAGTLASGFAAALASCGHAPMRRIFAWTWIAALPLYAILGIALPLVDTPHMHSLSLAPSPGFSGVGFFFQFALGAGCFISYAPYVSSYTRHLRRHTGSKQATARRCLGTALTGAWTIGLGAWLAQRLHTTDALAALDEIGNALAPGFGRLVAIVAAFGLLPLISLNTCSAARVMLAALDGTRRIRPLCRHHVLAKVAISTLLLACVLSIRGNGMALLHAMLPLLLCFLMPWAAIHVIDRFIARKAGNDGPGQWRGIVARAVGFAAMMSFAYLVIAGSGREIFTGYFVRQLDDMDIAWLVGLAAAGMVYLLLARSLDLSARKEAIRREARVPVMRDPAAPRGRPAAAWTPVPSIRPPSPVFHARRRHMEPAQPAAVSLAVDSTSRPATAFPAPCQPRQTQTHQ